MIQIQTGFRGQSLNGAFAGGSVLTHWALEIVGHVALEPREDGEADQQKRE
jgi:hypothetical protein